MRVLICSRHIQALAAACTIHSLWIHETLAATPGAITGIACLLVVSIPMFGLRVQRKKRLRHVHGVPAYMRHIIRSLIVAVYIYFDTSHIDCDTVSILS